MQGYRKGGAPAALVVSTAGSQRSGWWGRQALAFVDAAASQDLGVDAAVGVAETALHRVRNIEVAQARVGVDAGGRAALDPRRHREGHAGIGFEGPSEEIELRPRRQSADVDV